MFVDRSPARVYLIPAGMFAVYGSFAGGVPDPTRRNPLPSMATSSGLFVVWNEPSVISLRVDSICTPSPTCTGLDPPFVLVGPAAARLTWVSESANVMLEDL